MNNTLSKALIFVAGAAFGSAATWFALHKRYERIIKEDEESLRAAYAKLNSDFPAEEKKEDIVDFDAEYEASRKEYTNIIQQSNYSGEEVQVEIKKPKIITPEEFGELDDYETETLFYHADGVLTDVDNNIVEDIDNMVGLDSLTRFGEYDDDSVYVRNERLECDYEILLNQTRYRDIMREKAEE